MHSETQYYICRKCGNMVVKILNGGGTLTCCDQEMELLTANTTDAAQEKHVPAVTREGNKVHVEIGTVLHPMIPEHYITMIAVAQGAKYQQIDLKPGQQPTADFIVEDGPITVYEYCNLHGLWKAEA